MFSHAHPTKAVGMAPETPGTPFAHAQGVPPGHRLRTNQLRGFGLEAAELVSLRFGPRHPLDGAGVPVAGLLLIAELPLDHGQEEPVVSSVDVDPVARGA